MNRFQFVADHQGTFEVKRLCEVVEVNRSSFYAWQNAAPTRAERGAADAELEARIRAVHDDDNTCGAPRITAELNDGVPVEDRVNHKRVARVMRERGIAGYRRRRRVCTTIPMSRATPSRGCGVDHVSHSRWAWGPAEKSIRSSSQLSSSSANSRMSAQMARSAR